MQAFTNILAVLQNDQDAKALLAKLSRLTTDRSCDVSAIRVVYEGVADLNSKHIDASSGLKELVLEAARSSLRDAVDAAGTQIPNLTSAAMWNQHIWQGCVHTADETGADLIVKSTGDAGFTGLRTPDDWNLLRHAKIPVLLTEERQWPDTPTVVAAIDIYDPGHAELNDRILATAHILNDQLGGSLHLASVFPVLSNWLDEVTTIQSYNKLRQEIEVEIFDGLATLAAEHDIAEANYHALEGLAADAMQQLISALNADILVLGTKARKGVVGLLLGNTAEKLIHHVDADILTVN